MPTHALLLQLARHLGCYLQLGATAAGEYRSAWVRRTVLLMVAMATCAAGFAALWVAGLVGLWDTPWRLTYILATATLLLVVAIVTLYRALTTPAAGPAAQVFGSEMRKGSGVVSGMEEHAVAIELQQSRAQLRTLLLPDPATGRVEANVFPRSAVIALPVRSGQAPHRHGRARGHDDAGAPISLNPRCPRGSRL